MIDLVPPVPLLKRKRNRSPTPEINDIFPQEMPKEVRDKVEKTFKKLRVDVEDIDETLMAMMDRRFNAIYRRLKELETFKAEVMKDIEGMRSDVSKSTGMGQFSYAVCKKLVDAKQVPNWRA